MSDDHIRIQRLGPGDRQLGRTMFTVMAEVFGEEHSALSDAYLEALLARPDFWAIAAIHGGQAVGGLTAHTLMMTSYEGAEVFLYDIAVAQDHQRRGIGRRLVDALRGDAASQGISTMFVPADDEDTEAIQSYTALGGTRSRTIFFDIV